MSWWLPNEETSTSHHRLGSDYTHNPVNESTAGYANCRGAEDGGHNAGIVVKRVTIPELSRRERTGKSVPIVTIRMFVAILPVCSLLLSVEFVEGTISFMPFSPPAPVPAVFAAIPSMIVLVVPVVIPPLVAFVSLSRILTAVVLKIVEGLEPDRGNKSNPQKK